MKKKLVTLLLVGGLVASVIGCGQSGEDSATESSGSGESEETIELEIWHNATNREDPGHMITFNAIEAFSEANPHITVVESGQTTDNNKTRIRTAAAANELPDVFFTWGYGSSADLGTTGKMLDLSTYLTDDITSELKPGALDALTFDGVPYGLPDNGWYHMIFINEAMFTENNISVPTTYTEVLEASKKFVDLGIEPILVGGKQANSFSLVYDSIMFRLAGVDATKEGFNDPAIFDTPEALEAAQMVYDLGAAGAFGDTSYTLTNPEAGSAFVTGQYPMTVLNAGFIGAVEAEGSAVKGQCIAVPSFFEIEGAEYNYDNIGAYSGNWAAAANSEHPDEAFELLYYMSLASSQAYYETGSNQVPYYGEEWDSSAQSDLYVQATEAIGASEVVSASGNEYRPTEVVSGFSDLCVALSKASIGPEEFVKRAKELY